MKRIVFLLTIMLLSSFQLLFAGSKSAKQLDANLQQWKQFRWQGIIQVQSSMFSMRKNFVLAKNAEAVRLDVLDSGVMGLQAKPLVSLYLKDSIVLDAPTIKELAGIDLNWFIPPGTTQKLMHFADSLQSAKKTILKQRKFVTNNTTFSFDKKYRLQSIKNPDSSIDASIVYNRRNQPSKLSINFNGTQVAELQINEHDFSKIEIEPVKSNSQGLNLEELLDNIPLDELEHEPE